MALTAAQIKYIKEQRSKGYTWAETAEGLEKQFGVEKTSDALRMAMKGAAPAPKISEAAATRRKVDMQARINDPKEYNCVLVIPDLHTPYHHPDAFSFLELVRDTYNPDKVVLLGDECFPGEAEVMTEYGWQRFDALDKTARILQVNSDYSTELVAPERHVEKSYTGAMVTRKNKNYFSYTTANHNIIISKSAKSDPIKVPACIDNYKHFHVPRTVNHAGSGAALADIQLRLMCMLSADFTFRARGDIYGVLKKERKIERAKWLLSESGLRYSMNTDSRGYQSIFIHAQPGLEPYKKLLPKELLLQLSAEQRQVLLEELFEWDGYKDPTRNRKIFCSSLDHNIDFVLTLAHLSGIEASVRTVHSEFGDSKQVSVLFGKTCTKNTAQPEFTDVQDLPVYCVTVPSGMLLVKQQDSITVTGNCDKHAMSFHDSDPDLPSAGDELQEAVEYMHELYELFPKAHVLDSNHGSMHFRKAKHHGIPVKYLRSYADILEAPTGWQWCSELNLNCGGVPVRFKHEFGKDILRAAEQAACCLVAGHFHEDYKVQYSGNSDRLIWAMTAGCLIDDDSLAFNYNKVFRKRPILGCAVIINGYPQLIPMIMKKGGKWIGELP